MSDYSELAAGVFLSESEEEDLQYRERARQIFNDLKSALESRKNELLDPNGDGFLVKGRDIDPKYSNLVFRFLPEGSERGHAYIKGFDLVQIDVLKGPRDPEYLETRLTGYKDIFIHELIHVFDRERSNVHVKSSDLARAGDYEGYFNDPGEFNAYYQEGVHALEEFFEIAHDMVIEKVVEDYAATFQDFADWALENFFNESFVEHLNEKYRKKLLRRLSKWYESRPEFNS